MFIQKCVTDNSISDLYITDIGHVTFTVLLQNITNRIEKNESNVMSHILNLHY